MDINLTLIRLGMSRNEMVETFGPPTDISRTTKKYRTPMVYRYGLIEFYFPPWKSGGLDWVQEVSGDGSWKQKLVPPGPRLFNEEL